MWGWNVRRWRFEWKVVIYFTLEDSHSGLVRHLGKVVRLNGLRGFKSLIFRWFGFVCVKIKI